MAALVDQIEAAGPIVVEPSDDEGDAVVPIYEVGGPSHAPVPGIYILYIHTYICYMHIHFT